MQTFSLSKVIIQRIKFTEKDECERNTARWGHKRGGEESNFSSTHNEQRCVINECKRGEIDC